MRKTWLALALAAGVAFGGAVQAREIHFSGDNCGYSTDYDVRVTPDGIDFQRMAGQPSHVFMHDGQLRVDGRDVAVSADDAARLRNYETQVRVLLPEVAGIGREGGVHSFEFYTDLRNVMVKF